MDMEFNVKIHRIDVETGLENVVDADEITIQEINQTRVDIATQKEDKAQSETQMLVAKENAESKLAALGLTSDDLKALGLG